MVSGKSLQLKLFNCSLINVECDVEKIDNGVIKPRCSNVTLTAARKDRTGMLSASVNNIHQIQLALHHSGAVFLI